MGMELFKKHRPDTFDTVHGQTESVQMLEDLVRRRSVPHALLFFGPSGCGKTTLARILRDRIGCEEADFEELNCADVRGIDTIRDISSRMRLLPMAGRCRVFLIDEAHKLTNDAQNGLLKPLEDTPSHVYFMLCTTDPEKLIKAIRTRCTSIKIEALTKQALKATLQDVCRAEEFEIKEEVLNKIVDVSEGSARTALVHLHAISGIKDEDEQLKMILANDVEAQAIQVARALLDTRTTWGDMATLLSKLDKEDPESMRWMILAYARTVMLKNHKAASRCFDIIEEFKHNFYDSKAAGFAAACFAVVHSSKD